MATTNVRRKLTAILSADVKGYSLLMAEDEEATVHTLTAYREVMSTLIQQFRGRVVDTPGDNLLAEFASVVDAVQGAVEIQRVLRAKNAELAENRRMEFRIGVNLGDVIEEGDRIYGDGVNIAARLEGLAAPGGICISGTAYEHIENKLPLRYEYLGEHTVKNISKPIRVYRAQTQADAAPAVSEGKKKLGLKRSYGAALIIAAIIVFGAAATIIFTNFWRSTAPPAEVSSDKQLPFPLPIEPSIAVMPFENLSGDTNQDFIADGLSENIIASLSKIPEMVVSSRNNTFAYKGKHIKAQQVAEELEVRHVLEGSIQKSGNRLRITAQLIDAVTGNHLWTEQYEREKMDLFDLIDEVTHEINIELLVKLMYGEQVRAWANGTKNREAWGHVSKTLNLPLTKEGNARAWKLLEKAVTLDPDYADAWALLSFTMLVDASVQWSESFDDSYKKSIQALQKALALDDSNPLAHAILSFFHGIRNQYEKAVTEGEKAIALGAKHGLVHALYANALERAGRPEEVIKLIKTAMALEPYYSGFYLDVLADAFYRIERYEEAFVTWKQLLNRSQPGGVEQINSLRGLSLASIELGRGEEARNYAEQLFDIVPNASISALPNVKGKYKDKGRAELERIWGALRKAGITPPLLSTAEEYNYKGPPAFTLRYPQGWTEVEYNNPEKVFEVKTLGGVIGFNVFVESIPKDIKLEDVGLKIAVPRLEKELNAKIKVVSNEEIELACGTKAYKTKMELDHPIRGILFQFILLSAFKDNKWVYNMAFTAGDTREIEELVESLRFVSIEIPTKCAIQHILLPENISYTFIDIFIGDEFDGDLPDDIETIQIRGPSGHLAISKKDFRWEADLKFFWVGIMGTPEIGNYTVQVTSKNASGTATDTQSVIRNLPLPDSNTFSPAKGEVLTSKTPTFSWGAVQADVPVYYMLEIFDIWGKVAYWGGYVEGMTSFTVQEGILLPGKSYLWRVRVGDSVAESHDWIKLQNVALHEKLGFSMAQSLE
jgi:TolB-like protein/class 3 adenylate cyclase/tetratricopeptide (TPR) repeat protein